MTRCHSQSYQFPEHGAFLIEMALILPILILIFSGVFDLTQMLRSKHILSQTAYEMATLTGRNRVFNRDSATERNVQDALEAAPLNETLRGLVRLLDIPTEPGDAAGFVITVVDRLGSWTAEICGTAGAPGDQAAATERRCRDFQPRSATVAADLNVNMGRNRVVFVELSVKPKTSSILSKLFRVNLTDTVVF